MATMSETPFILALDAYNSQTKSVTPVLFVGKCHHTTIKLFAKIKKPYERRQLHLKKLNITNTSWLLWNQPEHYPRSYLLHLLASVFFCFQTPKYFYGPLPYNWSRASPIKSHFNEQCFATAVLSLPTRWISGACLLQLCEGDERGISTRKLCSATLRQIAAELWLFSDFLQIRLQNMP